MDITNKKIRINGDKKLYRDVETYLFSNGCKWIGQTSPKSITPTPINVIGIMIDNSGEMFYTADEYSYINSYSAYEELFLPSQNYELWI